MEIISGTLKSLTDNVIFSDAKIEFEYDIYGGIKEGMIDAPNLILEFNNLSDNYFYFRNNYVAMYIHINGIISFHFQTLRFKRKLNEIKEFNFYVTKSHLMYGQKIKINNETILFSSHPESSQIEFKNVGDDSFKRLDKCKSLLENILICFELVQLSYCKIFAYTFQDYLFINYNMINFKPFKYNRVTPITAELIELFFKKFTTNSYKEHLTKIIYRLVTSKQSSVAEQNYIWVIFTFEAITSLYNKQKGINYKKDRKQFNQIFDEIYSEQKLLKVNFTKKKTNFKYWKPMLWVYRDKLAHFIDTASEMDFSPDAGQDEVLKYIFEDNHNIHLQEFKKCLPIAQKMICLLIGLDYEKDFPKIYESEF